MLFLRRGLGEAWHVDIVVLVNACTLTFGSTYTPSPIMSTRNRPLRDFNELQDFLLPALAGSYCEICGVRVTTDASDWDLRCPAHSFVGLTEEMFVGACAYRMQNIFREHLIALGRESDYSLMRYSAVGERLADCRIFKNMCIYSLWHLASCARRFLLLGEWTTCQGKI